MTDIEALLNFRFQQAKATLHDAEQMLQTGISPRSVINRAYYAMFYSVLALGLKFGKSLKTSKHAGIIAMFDREFVHPGIIDQKYSRILHKAFEARQAVDYKEMLDLSAEEAEEHVKLAKDFFESISILFENSQS